MIRERPLNTLTFTPGATTQVELPKDAVYHQIQIELDGKITATYPNSAGVSVNTQFSEGFPFSLMARVRLVRNGSDTVWQGSGKQLAKECLYNNSRYPFARMWVDPTSGLGTSQAILQKAVGGLTIPANSEGIGSNQAVFTDTAGNNAASVTAFRCMAELYLQLGQLDDYFGTLVDARPLASFSLEIQWANLTDVIVGGTQNAIAATLSASVNCNLHSYDQDNVQQGVAFGTFKRASFQPPGQSFSSSQVQALLPRGNLYYGIILETLGLKAAGLVTIPQPGNDIVSQIQNRVNTNYYLRNVTQWRDLQAKNRNDGIISASPWDVWGSGPLGWAMIYYPCTGDTVKELIASFTSDTWDLLISTNGLTGGGDSNTYNGNPTINLLTQEVIPGKSVSKSASRGAFAGSQAATSASAGG